MNKIVIGAGFGDEGKGMFVDYLCSQSPNSLVIRFSGGQQAGHTVVTDTVSHVFSNFGSGTLQGASTYWSKYCTVEPIGLIKELKILQNKGINPLIFIDERCPITTPYDIRNNRDLEKRNSHGSCGVGVGSTIAREEKYYSLTFLDLFYPDVLKTKMMAIENFYGGVPLDLREFVNCCTEIVTTQNIKRTLSFPTYKYKHYIFEGSQGLLLDQHFGFFPHVTRSNTGCKNVVELLNNNDFEMYLITRAYQTRHGHGFMSNKQIPQNIARNPLETNEDNEYQGKFRRTILDVSLLEYAINKDQYIRKVKRKNLVITCLDHIKNEYRFTYKGDIINCKNAGEFVSKISNILNINTIYLSRTNNSKNIKKVSYR